MGNVDTNGETCFNFLININPIDLLNAIITAPITPQHYIPYSSDNDFIESPNRIGGWAISIVELKIKVIINYNLGFIASERNYYAIIHVKHTSVDSIALKSPIGINFNTYGYKNKFTNPNTDLFIKVYLLFYMILIDLQLDFVYNNYDNDNINKNYPLNKFNSHVFIPLFIDIFIRLTSKISKKFVVNVKIKLNEVN
eukprot:Mrub_06192.p2 GENE.Mrub_06192~~Mrub_06192.p2  ORF type:complete len:197 (+),score=8.38 Mrub_06192:326-916(+)